MFAGSFQGVSRMFQGSFMGVSMKIERSSLSPLRVVLWCFKVCKRSSKGVSRQFQRCFQEYSSVLKKVSSVFQENFIKSFKGVSRNFQRTFVLPFCCSMNLIAAT